jgi:hypothetical protein
MRCALCLREAELRLSHIIPEFLYKSMYDEKHRLSLLSAIPEQPNMYKQKGLREKLLCDACEQLISIWEGYASKVLNGGLSLSYNSVHRMIHVSGIDYNPFKLFQLSVLWRAGISKLPFFSKVELGIHSEALRRMLLASDPGTHERYGCIMIGIEHQGKAFTDVLLEPKKTRFDGHSGYRFVFGGFMWAMLASSHDLRAPLRDCTLSPEGRVSILIRQAGEMRNLMAFSRELSRLGRAPKT